MKLPLFDRSRPGSEAAFAKPRAIPGAQRLSVLEGHALWAATYDNDPNPLLTLEERELETLLPDLSGKYVLDVACGTGRWLARLLRRGAWRGAGLDLSAEMLRRAGEKPAVRGRVLRADCLSLPIRENLTDLIVCSFAVGYIEDLCAMARELARVSRPGSEMFLTDFHPAGRLRGWKRAFRYNGETVEISSIPRSIQQVVDAFEAGGFNLLNCLTPCLSEPERWIFEVAQRSDLYETACEIPAIFVCHFQRPAVTTEGRMTR